MRKPLIAAASAGLVFAAVAVSASPSDPQAFVAKARLDLPASLCTNYDVYIGSRAVCPTTGVTTSTSTSTSTPVVSTSTSTPAAPSSTTTSVPSSTTSVAATTSTTAPSTSSTLPPPIPPSTGSGCGLPQPAFCDTFDTAAVNPSTSRSGGLDGSLWGVSRVTSFVNPNGQFNEMADATLVGCGAPQVVAPPRDVQVCNGRLFDAVNDNHGQAMLAMYPKQPFDIAGRTGTVVFDVSADAEDNHAAWPEFWWTDQPVPAPKGPLTTMSPYARNSFGFSVADKCSNNETGIDRMMITRNYQQEAVAFTKVDCITKGSATGALNHFELRLSETRAEVWASDAGASNVKLIASADLAMPLTRGVIWLEDVHYNACKFGTQCDHTLAWDNVGFDGPALYRDLTFDVPDALTDRGTTTALGYKLNANQTLSVNAPGVYWLHDPTKAYIGLNWYPFDHTVPSVRINGGPWHDTPWPLDDETYVWRTIAIDIPFNEIHNGTNTIEFKGDQTIISNVNIILINAAPVP